jgi:hypothetical protein
VTVSAHHHRRRTVARVVLGTGTVFGLVYLAYTLAVNPDAVGINFAVYRAAAADGLAGDAVYGKSVVGDAAFTFRYPPVALLWFAVYLLVPPVVGYLAHAAGTLVVGGVLGLLLVRETERHGVPLELVDRVLIGGFVTVGSYVTPSLVYGNINHHVALAVALGLVWVQCGHETRGGVALGLAALPKVFPAGVGLWLLWRRAWRALAAAIATGVGGLLAGAASFGPGRTRRYVTAELLPRAQAGGFAGGLPASSEYVSLRRPLSILVPGATETGLAVGALLVLAPAVAYCWRVAADESRIADADATEGLVALFVVLAALLLALPSFSLYWLVLSYPLVPLLYILDSPSGPLFAGGALLSTLTLKLPDVLLVLDAAPLPAALGEVARSVARALYTMGTPVLFGTLLMMAACCWWAADAADTPS